MIHLEDPSYTLQDPATAPPPPPSGAGRPRQLALWMPTLRIGMGSCLHGIELRNQPGISIGGYFLLAQARRPPPPVAHTPSTGPAVPPLGPRHCIPVNPCVAAAAVLLIMPQQASRRHRPVEGLFRIRFTSTPLLLAVSLSLVSKVSLPLLVHSPHSLSSR